MKLKENFDYLYLKSHVQSKYDNYDYLPSNMRTAIKNILELCEEQEKELERLKNAEEYAKIGKETLLDTIHNQQEEIRQLELENTELLCKLDTSEINYIDLQNKIKDKIKELEESISTYNEGDYYDPFYNTDYITRLKAQIIILKSLLLEEGDPDAK